MINASLQNSELEQAILSTITYFDIFNFPLTSFEIWKNLYSNKKYSLKEIIEKLNSSDYLKLKIDNFESFYFIRNREYIVEKRKNNYISTYSKYKKGINFINFISSFHFIKAVFIANSMSIDNARKDSDIDLFIVARKGMVWFSRLVSAAIAQLLKLRPTEKTKTNKICLTIFIDEKNINLKRVCSKNDIYYIYWINQVLPIFDPSNVYQRFINENIWSRNQIVNIFDFKTGYKRVLNNSISKKILRKLTKIFSNKFLEKIAKKIEMSIFPKDIKEIIRRGDSEDVFADDTLIKLHNNNNRSMFHNLFLERTK